MLNHPNDDPRAIDLAILTGKPAFTEALHVGRPNIPDIEGFLDRARAILDRRWLSNNGVCVQELERKLCDFLGVKHCIATCNGTIALEIAVRAAGITGEVIVPSFTFIATPDALKWQSITPVFCDIDPSTHLLDVDAVARTITPRTTAILAVHIWGQPCAPEALAALAQKHRLKLIFDAAHAFGCSHGDTQIGNFGLAEVFSFHATKFFNTFEGGAIATNDDQLAASARLMLNFGFSGYDNAVIIGTNGKMSEISAAMGLSNFEQIDEYIAVNRAHYLQYQAELTGLPGLKMLAYPEEGRRNYQHIVVDVAPGECPITRDELVECLWAENVIARRYFYPGCHKMPSYSYDTSVLPATDRVSAGVLVLPTGSAVEAADITLICRLIGAAIDRAADVRAVLRDKKQLLA